MRTASPGSDRAARSRARRRSFRRSAASREPVAHVGAAHRVAIHGGSRRRAAGRAGRRASSASVRPAQAARRHRLGPEQAPRRSPARGRSASSTKSGSWRLEVVPSGRRSFGAGGCPRSACRCRRPSPCRRSSGRRRTRRSAPPSRRRSGPTPSPPPSPERRAGFRRGRNRPSPSRAAADGRAGSARACASTAMMPASRAVPSTSPFLASPWRISASVSGRMTTQPSAIAVRLVTSFSETSTMLAAPAASRCVSVVMRLRRTESAGRRRPRPPAASGSRRRGRCGCRPSTGARYRRMREDAALADDDAVGAGSGGASSSLTPSETSKVRRLRLLMPISLVPSGRARSSSAAVVHLDQHVHAEVVRRVDQRARLVVRDARHDHEDAIGAPGAGLEDLIGLEQEILAQGGQAGCLARLGEVFGLALEGRLVGQHREAGRAAVRIGAWRGSADRNRRGSGPSRGWPSSPRRSAPAAFGEMPLDGRREAARRRGRTGAALDLGLRDRPPSRPRSPGACRLRSGRERRSCELRSGIRGFDETLEGRLRGAAVERSRRAVEAIAQVRSLVGDDEGGAALSSDTSR